MACFTCIDKLAKKLTSNYKVDLIRAYELAEKAILRVENRKSNPDLSATTGNPSDYSVACTSTAKSMICPNGGNECGSPTQCPQGTCEPPWDCPSPPKANSHYVSNTCTAVIQLTCIRCVIVCREVGTCVYSGNCYYDCDDGFQWNPATQECEAIVAVEEVLGDGITFVTT